MRASRALTGVLSGSHKLRVQGFVSAEPGKRSGSCGVWASGGGGGGGLNQKINSLGFKMMVEAAAATSGVGALSK